MRRNASNRHVKVKSMDVKHTAESIETMKWRGGETTVWREEDMCKWSRRKIVTLSSSLLSPPFLLSTRPSDWVDLVSPGNVELWRSLYRSLTFVSVTSFLDCDFFYLVCNPWIWTLCDFRSPNSFFFVSWLTQSLHLTVLMVGILTNNMLLENTRSVARFTLSMLLFIFVFFISMFKSLQVASKLLMVSSEQSS